MAWPLFNILLCTTDLKKYVRKVEGHDYRKKTRTRKKKELGRCSFFERLSVIAAVNKYGSLLNTLQLTWAWEEIDQSAPCV